MSRILALVTVVFLSFSQSSFAQTSIKQLYDTVNHGVVELHVKSVAKPKKGQVKYKPSLSDSLGSGALINKEGDILTAAHVVGRASEIKVIFANGDETSGHVLWVDTLIDIAMIRARKTPKDIQPLKLSSEHQYDIGQQVIAIGAPFGISHSLSVGYLSGVRDKGEIPGTTIKPKLIQTDAAINQGNSGGPLFNLKGEIIGIVSHILSQSGGSNGIGFAVSSHTIEEVMDDEPTVFLGIVPYLLSKDEALALNNPAGYGVLIQQVINGTAADKINLKGGTLSVLKGREYILLGGDILLAIEDIPIDSVKSVMKIKKYYNTLSKGDKVKVEYLRHGEKRRAIWVVD